MLLTDQYTIYKGVVTLNTFDLTGRTALVTGGGSGMGFGIATAYAEAGANVVIADLNEEYIQNSTRKLTEQGYAAIGCKVDVSSIASFEVALEEGWRIFGKVDILANNAGITINEDALDITEQNWDKIFTINTKAVFFCSQAFAKRLKQHGLGGNIVIIASNAAKSAIAGQVHYSASKAAAANLAQGLAKEFSRLGINVNAICPGGTDTGMLLHCMEDTIEKSGDPTMTVERLRIDWGTRAPLLGRLIQPIEIGKAAVFLSSEAATIIRGQSISMDGGGTPY